MNSPKGADAMLGLVMAVLVATTAGAQVDGPTDTVKSAVQQVFGRAEGQIPASGSSAERKAAARKVTANLFDFAEMSQRSLGPAWEKVSPAEQQEFVRLFGSLIANVYANRIEQYSGERITYTGEQINGDEAKVKSSVITPKGSEIGIEYRMYRGTDGRWTVYDLYIEGFSLVGSYKAQFHRLLQRGTFDEVLKLLREKTAS